MTLIAIAAGSGRADIVTDTATYTHTATRMGHTSKVLTLPHLDAAVADQGSTSFAAQWRYEVSNAARHSVDFDDLVRSAPGLARAAWARVEGAAAAENAEHGTAATPASSVGFLIGYSAERSAFAAFTLASDGDFTGVEIEGLHVMPSPLDARPSQVELGRLRTHLSALGDHETADRLAALPRPRVPSGPSQWVELTKRVRRDRALADIYSGLKTYVGGDVIHTTLRRGDVSQRRAHRFSDSGAEFAAMMAGSLHPISQLAVCDCGSGAAFVDCCLQEIAGQSCPCQSGRVFGDCCSVRAVADVSVTTG